MTRCFRDILFFKPSRRKVFLFAGGFFAVCCAFCSFAVDIPPRFHYAVTVPEDQSQTIRVDLTVSVPLLSKKESVFLYVGDKAIDIRAYTDGLGRSGKPSVANGVLSVPVARGGAAHICYDVPVARAAKHGNRGTVTDRYAVFDGGQAFLLPAEFYVFDERGIAAALSALSFQFDYPEGWRAVVPFDRIENPQWHDLYTVNKNAFVFGDFEEQITADGLRIHTLPGQRVQDTADFAALFSYYRALFLSSPEKAALPGRYDMVLLPPTDGEGNRVIGGAGTGVVAASFDAGSLKDWQLLSHRLFHAFYDTAAPYTNAHAAPNLWLNEGLATYYETAALTALSEATRLALGFDRNKTMALTFDQYLYMRLKEPFLYNFAPMEEQNGLSGAMTEFLHYTAAPLVVLAFEDAAQAAGNPPNALLYYCLSASAFETRVAALEAAVTLLGGGAQAFCEAYLVGVEIPPLWRLKAFQPDTADGGRQEVLTALNDIETILASWRQQEIAGYPADLITPAALADALNRADGSPLSFLAPEDATAIRDYCPEVLALARDYYARATKKGIDPTDKDLRMKLYGG